MKTALPFTRITNDINGNPRYVCHFLNLDVHGYESNISLSDRYAIAVRLANTIGGRKYHTKKFGGGIVFQSYAIDSLVADISRITGLEYSGHTL